MLPSAGLDRILGTLRSPVYGQYIIGSGVSNVGTWMQKIGVGWLAWSLTHSPTWLGLIAFAELFPTVVIAPFAGAVADRHNRLAVIRLTQVLAILQASALGFLTLTGAITIEAIAVLTLLLGVIMAFNQPARLALIPSLVEPHNLNSAIGLNSVFFNLARFLGPALAGLIIAYGHIGWVFVANALTFGFFFAVLLRLPAQAQGKPAAGGQPFLHGVRDGITYCAREERIAIQLALLIAVSIGARPLTELLPGIAASIFGGQAGTLALLSSTFGIGAIVGGLWLAGRGEQSDLSNVVTFGALGIAAGILLFVATSSLLLAVPATLFLGCAMVITGAGTQTLLQLSVIGAMRGRVMSLFGLIIRGGPALGALLMGIAAEWTGLRWPLAAGALLVASAAILVRMRLRRKAPE
jgi:predicted MFS family arabinose efflux permease